MIQIRTQLSLIILGIAAVILASVPVQAHHSFGSQYDAAKPITLRGTVSKVDWVNPHTWVYIDIRKSDGSVDHWGIEAGNPATLVGRGLTKDSLKLGTDVVISGYQSKDGSLHVHGQDLTLPNAQPIFIGSAGIGAPYDTGPLARVEPKGTGVQTSGAWWMNTALIQRLGITDEQKANIERTFENHRQAIVSATDELERQEALLARLLDSEPVDRSAVLTQIDRVNQARSEMERAGAVMTLEMRGYLTRAQWEQLPRTNVTNSTTAGRRGAQ